MFRLLVLLALLPAAGPAAAQSPDDLPFTLELVEVELGEAPALHSFAWAVHDGKWLLVAGRTDGLHTIFGPNPFPAEFENDAVWVVDPATGDAWSRSLDELPADLAEPLGATNTEFHQDGETLYVVGGYGYSTAAGGKITFPTLTALDVPGLMEAVLAAAPLAPHVRQLTDERLKVTGGELRALGGRYYLIGGQLFDGDYTFSGSTGTQVYTEAVRAFTLADDGVTLEIQDYEVAVSDPDQLHRRDLTVAPVMRADEALGFGIYGGVFQPGPSLLPYRRPIYVTPGAEDLDYTVDVYEQQFGLYTCPALPLYDAGTTLSYTTFFGGMSPYYWDPESESVEMDPLVPFVEDVATLVRATDGTTAEVLQPFRMPGRLGSNAALIPTDGVPRYENGVVQLHELAGRTLVGHLYGGLEAFAPNPGMTFTDDESEATRRAFAVYVTPRMNPAVEPMAPVSAEVEGPFPNPFRTSATVALVLDRPAAVAVDVLDVLGRTVARLHDGPLAGGQRHAFSLDGTDLPAGLYLVRLTGEGLHLTRPVVRVR